MLELNVTHMLEITVVTLKSNALTHSLKSTPSVSLFLSNRVSPVNCDFFIVFIFSVNCK